jgi:hypothetical protein
MNTTRQGTRTSAVRLIALLLLTVAPESYAQVAGYRVGAVLRDEHSVPCRRDGADMLCEPSGDVYLRVRRGTIVEVDSSWVSSVTGFTTSPDIWRQSEHEFAARFGTPDSVRVMNKSRLPRAFADGVAAFWTKGGWCAVLSIKTDPKNPETNLWFDLTAEKRTSSITDCSVYPDLEP